MCLNKSDQRRNRHLRLAIADYFPVFPWFNQTNESSPLSVRPSVGLFEAGHISALILQLNPGQFELIPIGFLLRQLVLVLSVTRRNRAGPRCPSGQPSMLFPFPSDLAVTHALTRPGTSTFVRTVVGMRCNPAPYPHGDLQLVYPNLKTKSLPSDGPKC